jgi:glutaredoxin
MEVRMYSRRRCGLCDEAREIIRAVRRDLPFEFEEVLIDGNDALERDYGIRIPVVEVDGREEFEVRIDPARLRSLLRAGRRLGT